jgi:choline kinase
MAALGLSSHTLPTLSPRLGRRHSKRLSLSHRSLSQLGKTNSSDTEYYDNDVHVPSCDGFLDNSKSLSYAGGKSSSTSDAASISSSRAQEKERQAWLAFKNEIIRLAHTLKLKGWRRVPLDSGDSISVERLSGALTNAVYVVSPPADLPPQSGEGAKKPPAKVLLRIYGPQVDIDRENELSVLRRLARKKIGPRLLGTFLNGRFEQFFNATTLTPANLREPETSKQIAKRMRELHDGVELLEEEKVEGPSVWKNWDRWLEQAERTVVALDKYILNTPESTIPGRGGDAWKGRGLVCGAEWAAFKGAVDKYRKFLEEYYGGEQKMREKLVFAHNDVCHFPPPLPSNLNCHTY